MSGHKCSKCDTLFADDTALFISHDDSQVIIYTLEPVFIDGKLQQIYLIKSYVFYATSSITISLKRKLKKMSDNIVQNHK